MMIETLGPLSKAKPGVETRPQAGLASLPHCSDFCEAFQITFFVDYQLFTSGRLWLKMVKY